METESTSVHSKKKSRHLRDLEENDPCFKESKLSMKCLEENNYDKNLCQDYFYNYKKCKEFWTLVVKKRKDKGIVPYLPPLSQRDEIKKEYYHLIKKKLEKIKKNREL